MTIRRALDVLEEEGLIVRRRGRTGGTFVRKIAPIIHLDVLDQIESQLEDQGYRTTVAHLGVRKVASPSVVATSLGLPKGTDIWLLESLVSYDDDPYGLMLCYLPVATFPEVDIDSLQDPLCPGVVYKRENISPVLATPAVQRTLKVSCHQLLLKISRTVWDKDDKPLYYTEEFIHPEHLGVEVDSAKTP